MEKFQLAAGQCVKLNLMQPRARRKLTILPRGAAILICHVSRFVLWLSLTIVFFRSRNKFSLAMAAVARSFESRWAPDERCIAIT